MANRMVAARCRIGELGRPPPDHAHDDDDRNELQEDAGAHQLLGAVRVAAAEHVEKA